MASEYQRRSNSRSRRWRWSAWLYVMAGFVFIERQSARAALWCHRHAVKVRFR